MKKLFPSTAAKVVASSAAVAVSLLATLPALAAQSPVTGFVTQQQAASKHDIVPVASWAIVAVLVACIVGGIMYAFKREVGGFSKNPAWVAPISIMLSRDLAGDDPAHEAHAGGTHDATAHAGAPHPVAH